MMIICLSALSNITLAITVIVTIREISHSVANYQSSSCVVGYFKGCQHGVMLHSTKEY